jgi:hypothetical protein
VFQKFYSKMLAKRLIHTTSASDDAEKFMIAGLKVRAVSCCKPLLTRGAGSVRL